MPISVVGDVAAQFVVQPSQGKQATPYPLHCAVMRSYLAVVYEPCLQRVAAVRLMWAAFGYGACYGACSYGAQCKPHC